MEQQRLRPVNSQSLHAPLEQAKIFDALSLNVFSDLALVFLPLDSCGETATDDDAEERADRCDQRLTH